MAHYFIAYNNAADYNHPKGLDYAAGFQEAQKALEIAKQNTPLISDWEMALIEAQLHRFCWPVGSKPLTELHREYANTMRPVYQRLGENDPEIIAMFAESLMMLAPWKLWTAPPDVKPAIPETEELVMLLEKALEKHPTHPALCHFYVTPWSYHPHQRRLCQLQMCYAPESQGTATFFTCRATSTCGWESIRKQSK